MTRNKKEIPAEKKVPVRSVHIQNFLSLQDVSVSLGHLNVLVGPNGGGKSNFLTVFRFLGEVTRTDIGPALDKLFGGFLGARCRVNNISRDASINIHLEGQITRYSTLKAPDEYTLEIRPIIPRRRKTAENPDGGYIETFMAITRKESILLKRSSGRGRRITLSDSNYSFHTIVRNDASSKEDNLHGRIQKDASALSVLRRIGERNDTEQVGQLAEVFEDLRLFDPVVDLARKSSKMNSELKLQPDASNLAAVLASLKEKEPYIFSAIENDLKHVLPGFQNFVIKSGTFDKDSISIELIENGLKETTPLSSASFGTVRSIALFTMLRDPNPPRMTCLEEVDHGLHPHALDILVERLRDASKRSQIIVATHSPALVNRLNPEELIVFEKDPNKGVSRAVKVDAENLKKLMKETDFGLGEIWYSGLIGGAP